MLYELCRFLRAPGTRRNAAFLFLALAAFQVRAQGTPLELPQRLDRFHFWANGNIVTGKYASDVEEYGIRMGQNARIYGTATPGGVNVSKALAINTRNGVVVADAVQKLNARSIAKGIASVATGGGALGVALLAAPYVIDYLLDAGLSVQDGHVMNPGAEPMGYADDKEYSRAVSGHPWYHDFQTPCLQVKPAGANNLLYAWHNGYLTNCVFDRVVPNPEYPDVGAQIYNRPQQSVPPPVPGEPATAQQIEDALASKNPTPELLKELAEKGGHAPKPDPADKPKIENPQPSQEKTTTKTNPDGSTETTSCRTNGTPLANGGLKLTETCTTTKKDAQGNPTGTTTTESDDADPSANPEESLLCKVFPNVAACAELDTPDHELPSRDVNVSFNPLNLFGSGSCPVDRGYVSSITGASHSASFGPVCDALAILKPMFIAISLFIAYMIILPGRNE